VIREYNRALALENNPHTHKLLALELMQAGYLGDAISEFRLAEQGGEPDDSIHYYLGILLERIDQNGQARLEFEKLLLTQTCQTADPLCESARSRLEAMTNERNPRGF
jgi:Flp pilus assembly protein TadD